MTVTAMTRTECGTRQGVHAHRRNGEHLCDPCKLIALVDEAIPTRPTQPDQAPRISPEEADQHWRDLAAALGIDLHQAARKIADRLVNAYRRDDHAAARRMLLALGERELRELALVLAAQVSDLGDEECRSEDGIVDEVAIERAIEGAPIALTPTERAIAVHRMRANGASISAIAKRLHVKPGIVREILSRPVPDQSDLLDLLPEPEDACP